MAIGDERLKGLLYNYFPRSCLALLESLKQNLVPEEQTERTADDTTAEKPTSAQNS
jgi:hypothetical protein